MSVASAQPVKHLACGGCGALGKCRKGKNGGWAIPRNWRAFGGQDWCDNCWSENFKIVCVTIPAFVKAADGEDISGLKKEMWATLGALWRQCGNAMSWCTRELYTRDEALRDCLPCDKLPAYARRPYLYGIPRKKADELGRFPRVRERFPLIPGGAASIVVRKAEAAYRRARLTIFLGRSNLPTFAEQPYPLDADAYKLSRADGGSVVASLSLPAADGRNRRFEFELGNRRRFWRQLAVADQIVDGTGKQVEGALVAGRSGRNGSAQVLLKIVAWVPNRSRDRRREGTLLVATRPTSFLMARMLGAQHDERWTHEDHVRKRVAAHRRRLRRLSDDFKIERRVGLEPKLDAAREAMCGKQRRFLDTFLDQKSRQVAELARRLNVARVVYDDSCREWVGSFPWAAFWDRCSRKLGEHGVSLISAEEQKRLMQAAKEDDKWAAMFAAINEIGKEPNDDTGIAG